MNIKSIFDINITIYLIESTTQPGICAISLLRTRRVPYDGTVIHATLGGLAMAKSGQTFTACPSTEVKMSKTFSTSRTTAALAAAPRPAHPQSENFRRQSWDLHAHRAVAARIFNLTDERFRHPPAVLVAKRIPRPLNKPGQLDEVGHATAAWARTQTGSKK